MLSRRFQTLLSIRERAALLRLYFPGTRVQPNLQSHFSTSGNHSFSAKNSLVPISTLPQRWLVSTEKHCAKNARGAHTSTHDDLSAEAITENGYARSVLVNSKRAPKTIGLPFETIDTVSDEEAEAILKQDWNKSNPDDILKALKSLSCHAKHNSLSVSQDKHEAFLNALRANLKNLNDEQLRQIFQCLLLWKNIQWEKCPVYTDLWMAIDSECSRRLPSWSIETSLMFADYWYQLRNSRKVNYSWLVMRAVGRKPGKLNATNFLHLVFLVNVARKAPINMYEIEYRLDSILDEFTANELGIVAMAFFKSQTPFRDQKIVYRMQMKILNEWDEIHDISFSAIMKVTRYSTGLKELQVLSTILERTKSRVSNLSIPCLVHIAHAAAFVQCYNAELLDRIIKRFETNIDSARLKDIERISWVLSIFDYNSETPLYHKILEELRSPRRNEEITRYPTILPTTLMHLSHAGVFPLDLIQECLMPSFLHRVYNNNLYKIGWDFFALENNVKIERPEYEGPFLKDEIREFLAKKYIAAVFRSKEKAQPADKLILEVAHMCKLALGSDTAIHIDQVLPHYLKPDMIICLDETNNPMAPEPILSKMPLGTIKYAPQEPGNLKWIAVVLATQNQMMRGSRKYVGLISSKVRQLKKIGYTPLVIPHTEWNELKNLEAKENYLKSLLFDALDSKVSVAAV